MNIVSTPVFKEQKCFRWQYGKKIFVNARTKSEARASIQREHGKLPVGSLIVNCGETKGTFKVRETKQIVHEPVNIRKPVKPIKVYDLLRSRT